MIDYREYDGVKDDGYTIWIDKDGAEYKVTEPTQKDLMKILILEQRMNNVQAAYNKIVKSKQSDDEKLNKLSPVYDKLVNVVYDLFLFILNLNTAGKQFVMDDVSIIPMEAIQAECDKYMEYVNNKLKN